MWKQQLKTVSKKFNMSLSNIYAEAAIIKRKARVDMTDRAAATLAVSLAKLRADGVKTGADSKFLILQCDQNPSRSIRSSKSLAFLPCVTPKGRYFVFQRGPFLTGSELARAQGLSEEDIGKLFTSDCSESFKQDCVGNGFTTTVCAAAILSSLALMRAT